MGPTAIAFDPRVQNHDTGPGHPEQIARYQAVMARLESSGLLEYALHPPPRVASDDELALVHSRSYIQLVEREVRQRRHQLSTGDTTIIQLQPKLRGRQWVVPSPR